MSAMTTRVVLTSRHWSPLRVPSIRIFAKTEFTNLKLWGTELKDAAHFRALCDTTVSLSNSIKSYPDQHLRKKTIKLVRAYKLTKHWFRVSFYLCLIVDN